MAWPGNYDAVVDKEITIEGNAFTDLPHKPCICGMKSKEEKEVCCNSKSSTGRQYSSRCPCLNLKMPCTSQCKSKGCNNPRGAKPTTTIGDTNKTSTRKCIASQMSGQQNSGIEFLLNHD